MNNTLSNNLSDLTAETIDAFIQGVYEAYVLTLFNTCVLALLVHATVLKLSQEIEYIWMRQFSLPASLYFLSRYGSLIQLGLNLGYDVAPSITVKSCKIIFDLESFWYTLSFIGTQGILIFRAYSLCRGNKILAGVLAIAFVSGLSLFLLYLILLRPCSAENFTMTAQSLVLPFLQSVIAVFIGILVSAICVWQVWGIWKLRRETGIQSSDDLVSIVLTQSVIYLCFVDILSAAATIFSLVAHDNYISTILFDFQNCLSVILVSEFTLDLRQANSAKIEATNITLPTFQFQSVLLHVHQSFLVEMGTSEDIRAEEWDDDNDNTGSGESHWDDGEIVEEQSIPAAAKAW